MMKTKMEIEVKCPLCEDQFATTSALGEMEGCTICDDVFIIQVEDIVASK